LADQSPANPYEALSSPLKREDSELRWMLAALAALYLVLAGLMVMLGGGALLVGIASWVGGMAFGVVAGIRFGRGHAYSAGGWTWYLLAILLFQGWSGAVWWVAFLTRSPSRPVLYLGVIMASATLPLFGVIYAMSRRLTTAT
jgi:hypothetical protein